MNENMNEDVKEDMSEDEPKVVSSLEEDDGAYCVDILQHSDGTFTFAEYIREEDGWHLAEGEDSGVYKTEYDAYLAAVKSVEWLIA